MTERSPHWLDRLAAVVMGRPQLYAPLFPDGWGERAVIDAVLEVAERPDAPPEIDIDWDPTDADRRTGTVRGGIRLLPSDLPAARLLQIRPEARRQIVLMAASNDHGWATRQAVAERIADPDIGAVILEQPFYGTRRRHPDGQPIRAVSEFFSMGGAAVAEARGILAALGRAGHTVGVGGFSQGGSVGSQVSALAPVPVATALFAAGPSPGPIFAGAGILTATVAWEALGGRRKAEPQLAGLLGAIDSTRFPPPAHADAAVLGAARDDAYVIAPEAERLWRHWPGSELIWVEGGHASFHLWGKSTQASLIERAFRRFERSTLAPKPSS